MRKLGVSLNSMIKDEDMFGHQIVLNFNKQGESHKTLIGGFGSLLVQCFMVMYIYIRFNMFAFNLADSNITENGVIDIDQDSQNWDLPFSEMDLSLF